LTSRPLPWVLRPANVGAGFEFVARFKWRQCGDAKRWWKTAAARTRSLAGRAPTWSLP